MTTKNKRAGALAAGAVLAFGAYTVGSQAGDGVAESRDGNSGSQHVRFGGPGGPGGPHERDLSALANRLGVSESKLEDALRKVV